MLLSADYILPSDVTSLPSSSCDSCTPLYNEVRLCLAAQENEFELQLSRLYLLQSLRLVYEDVDTVDLVTLETSHNSDEPLSSTTFYINVRRFRYIDYICASHKGYTYIMLFNCKNL